MCARSKRKRKRKNTESKGWRGGGSDWERECVRNKKNEKIEHLERRRWKRRRLGESER